MTSVHPAPVDLSALPGYSRAALAAAAHTTAFLGRTSTKDNQDPRSSIPGQEAVCRARLSDGEEFAAYFWDVESGYHDLDERSLGSEEFYRQLAVPLRRDGGINELLAAAGQRRITRVVCERSDRAARDMLTVLTVERVLAEAGVELVYATEPPAERPGRLSSSHLRMRRSAQMDAELYGRAMQEMSMRGQVQHAVQGYNHGVPPYPYAAEIDPDAPLPDDRFSRRPKRRLVKHPDPRRWATAVEMFRLRRLEHAPAAEILETLTADPNRYPPATRWTRRLIEALLANPKLSGHQVYNRRSRTDGWLPIEDWSWSPIPAHPGVVTLPEWVETQQVTASLRQPSTALETVRAAVAARGLTMRVVASTPTHVHYAVGRLAFVVPRGPLDAGAAADLIARINQEPT